MNNTITPPQVFILGTQRSGTTLLTRILSSHPDFYAQNEEMSTRKMFTNSNSLGEVLTQLNSEFTRVHRGQAIGSFLEQRKIKKWGYKDPQFTEYLDKLEFFIGTSKFILITRDGRGVVNSYIDNKWGLGTNAYTGALRWKNEIRQQLDFQAKYPDHVLLIRFEDLIQNMEPILKTICKHINLTYSPVMLQYHQKKPDFKQKRENKNTNKKPDINISQKWMKSLSQREVDIIEHVANKELLKLGYKITNNPISITSLEKAYYNLHQKIIGEIQLQYRWRKSAVSDYLDGYRNTD
jgi:hypothetical protein